MQICPSSLILMLCLFAGPLAVPAAEPGPAEAARAMVESERKFYQTGQEKGTRAAFLAFLADDGIVFRPGPVNGKEVWGKRPENGFDLIWEPTFAAIARSADFGYTTGPAKWRANKKDLAHSYGKYSLSRDGKTEAGHFFQIWQTDAAGVWKLVVDWQQVLPPEKP